MEGNLTPPGRAQLRPRLGEHVSPRRHWVGGAERLVLRDERTGRVMVVGPREWRLISNMDGTRDLAGLGLAAGLREREVAPFVAALEELGLLGEESGEPVTSFARDLPVRALPGYGFECTGLGSCCSTSGTVLFTPLDAAAARAAAPAVLDAGHVQARAFTPSAGLNRTVLAVAKVDGACAYHAPDGCSIYPVRPSGCRSHPVRYVDVGAEIRVTPRLVCACELAPSQAPLTAAQRGRDIPSSVFVEQLPAQITVGERSLSCQDAVRWCDGLEHPNGDALGWCRQLADRLAAPAFEPTALRARIEHLLTENRWRATGDLSRRSLKWCHEAASSDRGEPDVAAEALLVRAAVFGGGLLISGDVGRALRRLEATMWVARRFSDARRPDFARWPLVVVRAVARANGFW